MFDLTPAQTEALKDHKITWWVYAGSERIRRNAQMRGQWGFDATCSCGWDSRTGGGLRRSVEDKVQMHKREVCWNVEDPTITVFK